MDVEIADDAASGQPSKALQVCCCILRMAATTATIQIMVHHDLES